MATLTPGPLTDDWRPRPTEIDCVMVNKVYASCTQTVTISQIVHKKKAASLLPTGRSDFECADLKHRL